MAWLGAVAAIGGTIVQAVGAMQQGKDAEARAEYEAKVAEQQGDEAVAASQRDAAAQHRQGQQILSAQRAAFAASGGGGDPSVIDVMGDTAAEVNLAKETELFRGEQQRRGYDDSAAVSRVEGARARRGGVLEAIGTGFAGFSSMYSRFGQPARAAPATGTTMPIYK